jgi:hypothetical protein
MREDYGVSLINRTYMEEEKVGLSRFSRQALCVYHSVERELYNTSGPQFFCLSFFVFL